MFQRLPNIAEDKHELVSSPSLTLPNACITQRRSNSHFLDYFLQIWIEFYMLMGLWGSSPDLSVRCEKLACMHEIYILGPQVWDLHMQVCNGWELAGILYYLADGLPFGQFAPQKNLLSLTGRKKKPSSPVGWYNYFNFHLSPFKIHLPTGNTIFSNYPSRH